MQIQKAKIVSIKIKFNLIAILLGTILNAPLSFSQSNFGVKLILDSRIDTTFYIKDKYENKKVLSFSLKNNSSYKIQVSNIPIYSFDFNVERKIDSIYYNIDSSCYFFPQANYPAGGKKKIILKKGGEIKFNFLYPPICIFEIGVYRIRFSYTYRINGKSSATYTKWYYFKVIDK